MRDRALLRDLLSRHPTWRLQDYALAVGRSRSWVKKWCRRLREADPHDSQVLLSRERPHHAPYPSWDPRVEERIVQMRQTPPEHLQRVPGPRALLYYLPRDEELQTLQLPLPRSTRTVWKILHPPRLHPGTPNTPSSSLWSQGHRSKRSRWTRKDVSTVPANENQEGKRQHVVEVCNFVDAGTSVLLSAQAREDFHAAFRDAHRHRLLA